MTRRRTLRTVRAVDDWTVYLVRAALSVHGLIADTGPAGVQAEFHIRRALEAAAYDDVHGHGAADHAALQAAKQAVDAWPVWKQGQSLEARQT